MKLSYSLLAIQLAAVHYHPCSTAFTFQRYHHSHSTSSTTTQLHASTDPLVAAYQKKSAAPVDFSLPSTSTPPPEVPPQPIVPEPSIPIPETTTTTVEPIQSLTDAITQAADSALDAAQSATTAAESLLPTPDTAAAGATSATAIYNKALFGKASATKASIAASAASKSSEKAPSLLDFVKERKYEESANAVGDGFSSAKENLATLKSNLLGDSEAWKQAGEQLSKGVGGVTTATKSMAAKTAAVGAAAGSSVGDLNLDIKGLDDIPSLNGLDADALGNLAQNLHFDQYGPWYVSAGLILLTLNAKEQAIAQAKGKFEVELKEAQEKAEEAAEAAMVAADGAKLAKELVAKIPAESATSKNVGDELLEQGRVRQLELEKEFMREELQRLKAEVQSLRNALAQVQQVGLDDSESVDIEIPIVKETMEPDPDEEAKILSVLKEIDEANLAAATKKKKTVTKRKVATKTKTAKKKTVTAKAKTVTAKAKTASKKKAAKKKAASKKKKAAVAKKDEDLLVVEEIAAAMKKEADKKEEEEKKVEEKIPVAASLDNPWGALKESTLKRKTIAQLTAYLGEREIDVAGFTKAEMVGTVLSL